MAGRRKRQEERIDEEEMITPEGETITETPADALFRLAVSEPMVLAEWQEALEEWNRARGHRSYADAVQDPWGREAAKRAFLIAYEIFGTVTRAARRLGISPAVVYRWTANDPNFQQGFRVAELAIADRIVERELSRALSPMAEMDSASAGMGNRLLKAFRPLQFRDSAPLAMPNVPTSSIDMGEGNPNPYATALMPPEKTE